MIAGTCMRVSVRYDVKKVRTQAGTCACPDTCTYADTITHVDRCQFPTPTNLNDCGVTCEWLMTFLTHSASWTRYVARRGIYDHPTSRPCAQHTAIFAE